MKIFIGVTACLLFTQLASATEYVNRITCKQVLKGGGQISLTFLDGDWNISNDAVGIVILREGNSISIDKANMHFSREHYAYTLDADANSKVLASVASGNTITLTGNPRIPNFYSLTGTKNKFECSAPLASSN
jgi:hypothetical protein